MESLRKLLPETGEASKVEDQVKELKDEMKSLEKVVLSMWQRNPYQREADLESQVSKLKTATIANTLDILDKSATISTC